MLPEQRKLFALCFPEAAGTPATSTEHYSWKFDQAPFQPNSYEYCAIEEQELAGYYAAIPYRYKVMDRTILAAMVCDVMTHPQMRGKGVFKKLGAYSLLKLKEAGIGFATGYPVRPEVIPGHLSVGWSITTELPVYVYPLRLDGVLRKKGLRALTPIVNAAAAAYRKTLNLQVRPNRNICLNTVPFDDTVVRELAAFYEDWIKVHDLCLEKTVEFLKWRLRAPGTLYKIHMLRVEGRLAGVAISRATPLQDIPSLALLDLAVLPKYERFFGFLLKHLQQQAAQEDLELIAGMFPKPLARRLSFLRLGVLPSPVVFKLITKNLNFELPLGPFKEGSYHFTWLDSDDL